MAEMRRRKTVTATIGGVKVGSTAPIMVQSMTNTDTADIPGTSKQIAALAKAGSEVVRVTVNNDEAAKAIPFIVEGLDTWILPLVNPDGLWYWEHRTPPERGRAADCRSGSLRAPLVHPLDH